MPQSQSQSQSKDNTRRIIASVTLAADDIIKLHRVDVFRVLSDLAQDGLLFEGAQYLSKFREDLADEVAASVEKLSEPDKCWVPTLNTQTSTNSTSLS